MLAPVDAPSPRHRGLASLSPDLGAGEGLQRLAWVPVPLMCSSRGRQVGVSHYAAVARLPALGSAPGSWHPGSLYKFPWFSLKTQERSREGGTSLGLLHPTDLRGWVSVSVRRTAAVGSTSGPRAPAGASTAQWCGRGSLGVSGSVSSSAVRLAAAARLCMVSRWCCLALL